MKFELAFNFLNIFYKNTIQYNCNLIRAVLRTLAALGTNHNLKRNLIFVSISQPTALHMHVCHLVNVFI